MGPTWRWPATIIGIGIIIDRIITTLTRGKSIAIIVMLKEITEKNSKKRHIASTHAIDITQGMVKMAVSETGTDTTQDIVIKDITKGDIGIIIIATS